MADHIGGVNKMAREWAIAWFEVALHNLGTNLAESEYQPNRIRYKGEIAAVQTALAALRGPVPDPITGLMPCGNCGQKWRVFA